MYLTGMKFCHWSKISSRFHSKKVMKIYIFPNKSSNPHDGTERVYLTTSNYNHMEMKKKQQSTFLNSVCSNINSGGICS